MNIKENELSNEIKQKYNLSNNTLIYKQKDDPKDRIEIEIGDSKQANDLYTQIKIKRWDNEVNASFRLIDDEKKTFETDENKIKLIGTKKEIHLYELSPSDDLPNGGYEFEIILKEKPNTNKIEFSIQTKELDFFYQPELTQKEKDNGVYRPDNVIGSYAVYHKTKNNNIKNGKHYKCGKAFHIYRPRIEDSKGTWVWGELSVDLENNKLIVTIPQDFINNAYYPIIVDPTFGYEDLGESQLGFGDNELFGSRFQMKNEDGLLTKVTIGVGGNAASDTVHVGIYEVVPSSLIGETQSTGVGFNDRGVDPLTHGWVDLIKSGSSDVTLNANDYYFLLMNSLNWGYEVILFDETTTGSYTYMTEDPFWPHLANPLSSNQATEYGWDDYKYSTYVTYSLEEEEEKEISLSLIGSGKLRFIGGNSQLQFINV